MRPLSPHLAGCILMTLLGLVLTGFWAFSGAWDGSIVRHEVSKPQRLAPANLNGGVRATASSPAYIQEYVRFIPYNVSDNGSQVGQEIDLWNLEGKKFVRSPVVVSPDHSRMAYSEVLFQPKNKQTYSKLYIAPIGELQNEEPILPSEGVPAPQPNPYQLQSRYDPNKTLQTRYLVLGVGHDKTKNHDFQTLTVVDWSSNSQRLLFKQKSGVLHLGLRTSDILVYDVNRGTVTIYPEISRIVTHYWAGQGNYPHIENVAWEIYPLGWEEGSDTAVLFKAWAFDHEEKKFLGLWRYDVDAERANLVSLNDQFVPVAANGMKAELQDIPLVLPEKKKWWQRD